MTSKNRVQILIAGCEPKEREHVEARVKAALGPQAASGGWTVSLVKLQRTWSVTLDGPDGRGKTVSFEAPDERLPSAIREAIERPGSTAAASPSSPPISAEPHPRASELKAAPPSAAPPRASELKAAPQAAGPNPRASGLKAAPQAAAPAPRASGPRAAPAAQRPEARRDEYKCPTCGGGFAVVYEAPLSDPVLQTPVACPHCWNVSKVPIAESAGATGDYRAETT